MGNKFSCCGGFFTKKSEKRSASRVPDAPAFSVRDALVDLPPSVAHDRLKPQPPQCLLDTATFLALQNEIPATLLHRKLELVYASWEHGFSQTALRQLTADHLSRHSDTKELLLLVRPALRNGEADGSAPSSSSNSANAPRCCTVGAFIPSGIDFQAKKYVGTDSTFVFTTATHATSPSPSSTPPSYGAVGEQKTASGEKNALHVFRCTIPKVNEYFVRVLDGAISIGGGGSGPAVLISEELDCISSSVACPTFGGSRYCCLLPTDAASGVVVECGQARAPILTIEIWTFSNTVFHT